MCDQRYGVHPFLQDFNSPLLPQMFQIVKIVLLPNPKKDLSSVRSWQPIALLSCLGKGLERLIAKRLSRVAINHSVVSPQQFSALLKRSALDLVSCVIHEMEGACSRGLVASLFTFDVKGAFDNVLPGRMQSRLSDQGWPCWIK